MISAVYCLVLVALAPGSVTNAARILGMFVYPAASHQIALRSLTTELLKRGHELTVFTTLPMNDPKLVNYTEVDMQFLNEVIKQEVKFLDAKALGLWNFLEQIYALSESISDKTFSHPAMQRIISPNSTEKFDLIIVQCIYHDAMYILSSHLNAPMIGVSTLPIMPMHNYIFGNPFSMAYVPYFSLGYSDNMDLWQRIINVYYNFRVIYGYLYNNSPKQERVLRKYFGSDAPRIHQLWSNLSILLHYTHPFFGYPRPNVPAVISVGGRRKKYQKKGLPTDLKGILDDSKNGFIYFSLGSNVKSSELPNGTLTVFMETFAELPYTVLWKFESENLVGKPDNVFIRKWLPQEEILAHPNVVLFIYQGGIHSTEEALDNGIPLIGCPVFSDQTMNVDKLVQLGVGKGLDIFEIEKNELKSMIQEVITNSSYKENAVRVGNLLRDLPYDPIEHAAWWAEHVIRHKGASHLHNRSRDLRFYELAYLDVISIVTIIAALSIYASFVIMRFLVKLGLSHKHRSRPCTKKLPEKQQ